MPKKKLFNRFSQAHSVFVFMALAFGLVFAYSTPPLWGVDETSHFARVYQLSKGDILPNTNKSNYGGSIPKNLYDLGEYTKTDLLNIKKDHASRRKDVDNRAGYKQYINQPFSQEQTQYLWTAIYSPVSYLGALPGVLLANLFDMSIGNTLFLARLGSLLLYVVIVWYALRLLKDYKLKWLIFITALLPIAVYQASVVTADNIANGLALLFIALFIRLATEKNDRYRNYFYLLVGVGLLLPLIKINYVFLSLAILLLPNKVIGKKKFAIAIKSASALASLAAGLVWSSVAKVTTGSPVSQRPDGATVIPTDQLAHVMHNPLDFLVTCIRTVVIYADSYIQSMSSLLGWNFIAIPFLFILVLFVVLLFAAMNAKDELTPIRKIITPLAILSLLGIGSIFGALYIAFNPTGANTVQGVQGRYFLPFLLPIIMWIVVSIPVEVKIKDKLAPHIFSIVTAVCLATSVIYYLIATY